MYYTDSSNAVSSQLAVILCPEGETLLQDGSGVADGYCLQNYLYHVVKVPENIHKKSSQYILPYSNVQKNKRPMIIRDSTQNNIHYSNINIIQMSVNTLEDWLTFGGGESSH